MPSWFTEGVVLMISTGNNDDFPWLSLLECNSWLGFQR